MAVTALKACFTPSGEGELLNALGLVASFAFQPELQQALYTLQERSAEPAVGRSSAALLEQLRNALSFSGLFVLDPPANASNGSLGLLPLRPNVAARLLGSTLSPDDSKGPDGSTLVGLNTFAQLIAGPGKYTFQHGTAGGGFVITADQPSGADLDAVPSRVRHALLYARAKEKLLKKKALRCAGRACDVKGFRAFVELEVAQLLGAAEALATEMAKVQDLFLEDLRRELLPSLQRIRGLRKTLRCRFLWRRTEVLGTSLCQGLAPLVAQAAALLLGLAVAALLGVLTHYKVWRHFNDNNVVLAEMRRFQRKYGGFQRELKRMQGVKTSKKGRNAAYAEAVEKAKGETQIDDVPDLDELEES